MENMRESVCERPRERESLREREFQREEDPREQEREELPRQRIRETESFSERDRSQLNQRKTKGVIRKPRE